MADNVNSHPHPSPEGQPVVPVAPDQQPVAPSDPAPEAPPAPSTAAPYPAYQPQAQQAYGQGYAPQPYPGGFAPPPQTAANAPGSGKALASLVCGICAIVFSGTVVISLALGVVAIVLAAQYVKAFGSDAKATGGKVCGIIGIACSVLMLAFYLLMGAFIMEAVYDYASDGPHHSRVITTPDTGTAPDAGTKPDTTVPDAAAPAPSQTQDVAAAKAAVAAQLDAVENADQATIDAIAREADREFADDLGFSLTEIGMDPAEFAAWLAKDMGYAIEDSGVHLKADGTGDVLVTAQARSFKELVRGLAGQTSAYVNPERLDRGASAAALDDATKSALNDLVRAAMDKATVASARFSVDVVKAGGTWAVEHDEFDSIIDDVFDL